LECAFGVVGKILMSKDLMEIFFFLEVFFLFFGMGKKYFHYLREKKKRKKPSTHASHTHEKSGLVGTMTQSSSSYHMHCAI
jgi:hypothetical protein